MDVDLIDEEYALRIESELSNVCVKYLTYNVTNENIKSFSYISCGSLSILNCRFTSLKSHLILLSPSSSSTSSIYLSLREIEFSDNYSFSIVSLDSHCDSDTLLTIETDISDINITNSECSVIDLDPVTFDVTFTGNVSCSSEGNRKGGVIKAEMREGGSFNLFSVETKNCKTSNSNDEDCCGRGGFLYMGYMDSTFGDINENILLPINFFVITASFIDNSGTYGNNLFIYCYDIPLQANLSSCNLNFTRIDLNNAFYGCSYEEIESPTFIDLLIKEECMLDDIYLYYQHSTTFVIPHCRSEKISCCTIDDGCGHININSRSDIIIINKTFIVDSVVLKNIDVILSDDYESGDILLNENFKGGIIDNGIFIVSEDVVFNHIDF